MELLRLGFEGSLVADALAMPVHWYYDRDALKRDYGVVDHYLCPKKRHPGSILWRSKYEAINPRGDILRDQAQFWGEKEIHYHQFLQAGENTLNFKLASELYSFVTERGAYDADAWLDRYISRMLEPKWHQDTYVEEYHREFFSRYSKGKLPRDCGISDEHIGGLATVPALVAAIASADHKVIRKTVQEHVGLTHRHEGVLKAADDLVQILLATSSGMPLREAIRTYASNWISTKKAEAWSDVPDEHVVGAHFSSACYIKEAMPASLYLAWKYHDNFTSGIVANAMVGGDNCHRGAVVGSLLATAAGSIPEKFIRRPQSEASRAI
jgi:ADP-ribosyl-[dinitrogen reductase] hydrolase